MFGLGKKSDKERGLEWHTSSLGLVEMAVAAVLAAVEKEASLQSIFRSLAVLL